MSLEQSYTEPDSVVYLIGFSRMLNRAWFNGVDNQEVINGCAAVDKF